ncbi:polyribonucleotide nucleotidyltransferase [Salinisphaera sp.]|uniref:polyribonucleotide nucleotidyltransferase n=1 Tax=Salinisphaera sp. TaxID=1914330 RepID=UPI0025DC1A5C|nr:polyribonucleotide nucleotidyltransferase [Salinisphaera sp.]
MADFRNARRAGIAAAMAVTLVGTTACGVILYPERKGQVDGRIDPAVAVLDGIGLLFFIVPGVIAFAVDFATGAIYLPGSASNTTLDLDEAELVKLKNGELDAATIERMIEEKTGEKVSLADPALRTRRPDSQAWLPLQAVLDDTQVAALTGGHLQAAR